MMISLKVNEIEEFPLILGMNNILVEELRETQYKKDIENLELNSAQCSEE